YIQAVRIIRATPSCGRLPGSKRGMVGAAIAYIIAARCRTHVQVIIVGVLSACAREIKTMFCTCAAPCDIDDIVPNVYTAYRTGTVDTSRSAACSGSIIQYNGVMIGLHIVRTAEVETVQSTIAAYIINQIVEELIF